VKTVVVPELLWRGFLASRPLMSLRDHSKLETRDRETVRARPIQVPSAIYFILTHTHARARARSRALGSSLWHVVRVQLATMGPHIKVDQTGGPWLPVAGSSEQRRARELLLSALALATRLDLGRAVAVPALLAARKVGSAVN